MLVLTRLAPASRFWIVLYAVFKMEFFRDSSKKRDADRRRLFHLTDTKREPGKIKSRKLSTRLHPSTHVEEEGMF